MSEEEVLFHSDVENITVTNLRLIYGNEVTEIGSLKGGTTRRSVSIFNDHPIAVMFGWKKWHLYIFRRSGGTLFEPTSRLFPEDVAKKIAEALTKASVRWEIANDPRKGLNLPPRT